MTPIEIVEGIDAAVKLITLLVNSTGAQDKVGAVIAARIADGGRGWTDAERQEVIDTVQLAKAYAIAEANKPDA